MPPPHHHDHHHDHHHHPPHHGKMEDWDDYWWRELPKDKQDAATILGWTEKMWDDDGKADTEDLDWDELSHEQRKAAESFGYHPKLWNEGEGHHHPPPPHHHDHHHHHPEEAKKQDEKKEDEDGKVPDVSGLKVDDDKKTDGKTDDSKTKPQFKMSRAFGGTGGTNFDHGNNRHISKIMVYADGHVVKGLSVSYANATQTAGECKGKPHSTFELAKGECIVSVTVRSNKFVQSLAFKTNKGNELGPCGGKGWPKLNPLGNDTEGEEVKVAAPFKYQLCGFVGRAGNYLDQVAFRWGPVPTVAKK